METPYKTHNHQNADLWRPVPVVTSTNTTTNKAQETLQKKGQDYMNQKIRVSVVKSEVIKFSSI